MEANTTSSQVTESSLLNAIYAAHPTALLEIARLTDPLEFYKITLRLPSVNGGTMASGISRVKALRSLVEKMPQGNAVPRKTRKPRTPKAVEPDSVTITEDDMPFVRVEAEPFA